MKGVLHRTTPEQLARDAAIDLDAAREFLRVNLPEWNLVNQLSFCAIDGTYFVVLH